MDSIKLLKQGFLLEYLTLAWNVIGCIILIITAYYSNSVALLGFGIDSVIEIFASLVVIWQLKTAQKKQELIALRFICIAFLLLSFYIVIQSCLSLLNRTHPMHNLVALIWLILTSLIMFSLSYGKKLVGKKLNNHVLIAEANVTFIDGILAVVVLLSLLLYSLFNVWWLDAATGFLIALYAIKECLHTRKEAKNIYLSYFANENIR